MLPLLVTKSQEMALFTRIEMVWQLNNALANLLND